MEIALQIHSYYICHVDMQAPMDPHPANADEHVYNND